jgi:hypothetical protein
MGGTIVFDGCPSHGERRTGSSLDTREFGSDSDFDKVGLGAGAPVVYATPRCLDMHGLIAQLLGLALKGGGHQVIMLAASASSRV